MWNIPHRPESIFHTFLSPTAELYEGAVGVDDPGLQGVREVSVSVQRPHHDHCDGEDHPAEYEKDYKLSCLAGVIYLTRLCKYVY